MERTVTATELRRSLTALLDAVSHGATVIVTKRGRAVARLVPIEAAPSLTGTVTYAVDDELVEPLADAWEAAR